MQVAPTQLATHAMSGTSAAFGRWRAMYHLGVGNLTAFILAGGKSTRMGLEKAFLELGGRSLLVHALDLAATVADTTIIAGDASKFGGFGAVVEDVYPGCGPLGGIHAALQVSRTELNLMLAVDLPFLQAGFLQYLKTRAAAQTSVVTVPRAAGGLQPLCAIYRPAFAEIAEKALREGNNKIDSLFAMVQTEIVEERELILLGFPAQMFRNLNTPGEWEEARKQIQ